MLVAIMCSLVTDRPEIIQIVTLVHVILIGSCLLAFILYFTAVNTQSKENCNVLVNMHLALIVLSLVAFIIYLILPRGIKRLFFNSDRRYHVHSEWWHRKYINTKSTHDLQRMENTSILHAQAYLEIANSQDKDLLSPFGESTGGRGFDDVFRKTKDNQSTNQKLESSCYLYSRVETN